MTTRLGVAVALAIACAHGTAGASPAAAKAANARGVGLLKQRNYKRAAAQFRKAIAEDRTQVLAHYNLACAASIAKDMDTALPSLSWAANAPPGTGRARPRPSKPARAPALKGLTATTPTPAAGSGPAA